MKRNAIFIAFLILSQGVISLARAQDDDDELRKFEGRLILGANITQVDGDTYAGYNKIGVQTGPSVYVHFNTKTGISMDMLYSQKGMRGAHVTESYAIGTYFDKYSLNLNYIEIPVTLHYKLNRYYDLEAGVSYARLLRYKEWADTDVPIYFDPALTYFNKNDFEYVAGLSVQLAKHWFGAARLQYSIVPIRPWDRVLPRYGDNTDQYNNVVVFRLIYRL